MQKKYKRGNMKKFLKLVSIFLLTIAITGCETTKPEDQEKELTPQEMIKKGKIDEAKSKFQITTDINALDEDGNSVLHLAALIDDADLVEFFIFKGADPELKNKAGDTPLHVAIKNNSLRAAKILAATGSTLFTKDGENVTALDAGLEKGEEFYNIFITPETGTIKDPEGKTIVHYFVESKNRDAVLTCINKGLPISIKDNKGLTPLDLAFNYINDYESVQIAADLIQGGADEITTDFAYFQNAVSNRNLSERYADGQTPLHLSSIHGHKAIAEYLLKNNASSSAQDSQGSTPLHEAVRYGNLEIAALLLENGANVNAKDNIGKTPIMILPPQDKVEKTYKLLIENKADLTQKDMYGDTILHTAAMLKLNSELITLLTKNGADINARNKEGVTPLHIAIQQQDAKTIKLLTTNGANIHSMNKNKQTPLTLALNSENEIFEATINSSNIMSQDSDGNTPLHIAILNDAGLPKIKYIISLTEDVNIRNSEGNNSLFLAILKNRQKVGEMLLAKNADIFATNTNNNSPLKVALRHGGTVQDWLITSRTIRSTDGSGNTVLHYAAEWEFADAIDFLIIKGADIHAKNANGETCLFSAVKTNNPEIIQSVISGGASIKDRDNMGNTALHTAVRYDALESMKKVIDLGVNINTQNTSGKSCLSEAVLSGKYDIAKFLLENGADANSCDKNGVTILMDTVKGSNNQVVKLLLENNANPNLMDNNGRNAFHEAATLGDIEIISLIRNAGVNPLSRDRQGNTPFSIAMNKDIEIVKAVLGNNPNLTDTDGNTPVHITVKNNGSDTLLVELLNQGYPVDTRNSDGYTPVTYAISNDRDTTARILLERGANPFQTIDKKGTNAVTIALKNNNKQIISDIVKYAYSMTDTQGNTILHYAAQSSSAETVKTLLSYGVDTNVKNIAGDTPYAIAVRWKRTDVAKLLADSEK